MKYLIISTATNRLPDYKPPADHKDNARLAELAAITFDSVTHEREDHHYFVKPEGWRIDTEAAGVNGLVTEQLLAEGLPIGTVLDFYRQAISENYAVVGHSVNSHLKIMRGELRRHGADDLYASTLSLCTMLGLVKFCGLTGVRGQPKWPKLGEAYQCCFREDLPEVPAWMTARRNATAVLRLLQKMIDLGIANSKLPTERKED